MADFGISNKRELIQKAKSSQFLIVIIASVVVSASLIGTKILWAQRSYQAQIIDAKNEANETLESNIAAVEELGKSFDELEKSDITSSLVLDALPSKYDFPALVTTMEKLATLSGVEMLSFVGDDLTASSVNTEGQPSPVPMPFSVRVGGSYTNIKRFVTNMQKSIRPFNFEEMKIEAGESGVEVDFKMTTYYMPAKSLEIRKRSITSGGAPAPTDPNGAPVTTQGDVSAGVDTSGVQQ